MALPPATNWDEAHYFKLVIVLILLRVVGKSSMCRGSTSSDVSVEGTCRSFNLVAMLTSPGHKAN